MHLLGRGLADLADGPDLHAVLVVDGVLVVDLDELGLLVHDQHRLGEDRAAALCARDRPHLLHVAHDLLGGPLRGGDVRALGGWIDRLPPVGGHVLRPLRAVPVAQLVPSHRVGVPVGRRLPRGVRHRAEASERASSATDDEAGLQLLAGGLEVAAGVSTRGSPVGPARRRDSARPTVARLRSSHDGEVVAVRIDAVTHLGGGRETPRSAARPR